MANVRRRVLVVDDNRDAAESLGRLIEGLGHDVRVTHDSLHALEVANLFLPEVIFLDLGMPGMTGYEVAQQLKLEKWRTKTKIVVCSGYATEEYRERTRQAGCDMHFAKPMDIADIRKIFDEL